MLSCLRSQGRIIGSSIILVNFTWKSNSPNSPNLPPPLSHNRLGPAPSFPGIFATQVEKERRSIRSFGGSKFTAKFETSGNFHRNFHDTSKWSQNISRFPSKFTCFQMKKFISEMNIYKKNAAIFGEKTHTFAALSSGDLLRMWRRSVRLTWFPRGIKSATWQWGNHRKSGGTFFTLFFQLYTSNFIVNMKELGI